MARSASRVKMGLKHMATCTMLVPKEKQEDLLDLISTLLKFNCFLSILKQQPFASKHYPLETIEIA